MSSYPIPRKGHYIRKVLRDPRITAVAVVLAFLLMQGVRVERTNPPVQTEIPAKPEIKPLLQKACYNCHSNQTDWPWYSRLSPASWLIVRDVNAGRERLNFSEWGTYRAISQSRKLDRVGREIMDIAMPPWYYSMLRKDASLTPDDRAQVWAWAASESDSVLK